VTKSRVRSAAAAAAGGLVSASALAHSPIPGIGIFYSGALHPFISPAHLVALLALGLAIGQRGQRGAADLALLKPPLLALLAATVAALAITLAGMFGDPDTDRVLLVLAASTGLAVAAAWGLPPALLMTVAAAVAVAVLIASAPTGVEAAARRTSLIGTSAVTVFLVSYVAVMVAVAQRAWLHVAVRVLGSWLAAAALLVLALSFAPTRGG
jgi:hypothetical protein